MAKIIRCYKPGGEVEDITYALSIDELRRRLKGYVEIHNIFRVTIACDEEGKLKGLKPCGNIAGINFVGDIYVGELKRSGLSPVSLKTLETFDKQFLRY